MQQPWDVDHVGGGSVSSVMLNERKLYPTSVNFQLATSGVPCMVAGLAMTGWMGKGRETETEGLSL